MEKNLSFVGHEVVINGAHHVRAGAIELVLLVDRLLCNKHGKVFEKDGVEGMEGGVPFIPDAFPTFRIFFRPIGSLTLLSGKCDYQICFPISTYILLPRSLLSILPRDNGNDAAEMTFRFHENSLSKGAATNVGKVAIN